MTGLYVHVPFCARACPYCDFDFVVGRNPDVATYFEGLEAEAERRAPTWGECAFQTVYLGGGTPSMLGPEGLAKLLTWLNGRFDLSGCLESTVELNPEHVDDALLEALVGGGVGRVSLGVQSFEPRGLKVLGRVHQADAARRALVRSRALGLSRSVDLIVGWPGQTPEDLRRDLAVLLDEEVEHVSIYALTIEPDTPWMSLVAQGTRTMPEDDLQADLLELTAQTLESVGYRHYEVASYARPGASVAQHNVGYWTWEDYMGLGPSAASARFGPEGGVERVTNPKGLRAWESAEPSRVEVLDPEQAAIEGLWTGLRLLEGMDVERFSTRFPGADRAWLEARIRDLLARGDLLWAEDGRLRVSRSRWLFHDEICAALF